MVRAGRSFNFMNGFSADDVQNPNYNSEYGATLTCSVFPVVIDNNIPNLTASDYWWPDLRFASASAGFYVRCGTLA